MKQRWVTEEDVSDAMSDLIEENRQLRAALASLKEQQLTPEEAQKFLWLIDNSSGNEDPDIEPLRAKLPSFVHLRQRAKMRLEDWQRLSRWASLWVTCYLGGLLIYWLAVLIHTPTWLRFGGLGFYIILIAGDRSLTRKMFSIAACIPPSTSDSSHT